MLEKNQTAPAFSTSNQHGEMISLSDYLGSKIVVLYFYPKDDTSGCTIEANEFTALANEFAACDTVILGVSKDDCQSHQAFIKKFCAEKLRPEKVPHVVQFSSKLDIARTGQFNTQVTRYRNIF